MRILVTGGAGYIGSVLVPLLIDRGHGVRIVDTGIFGLDHVDRRAELVQADVLSFRRKWLDDIDAVIHLAGLSNDPMAMFSPSLNYVLNAACPANVAHAAKDAGVRRFVFGSTCSVYGLSDHEEIDETHDARPSFPYAISKLMAERGIGCLADDAFRVIVLRKGTVVGWSPRMRFDLVTNAMVMGALTRGRVLVHNPNLWRPLIDVNDAAMAYCRAVEADLSIAGTFNVAGRNYSIGELGQEVVATLGDFGVRVPLVIENRADMRSYRVSTKLAANTLGFEATTPMRETVRGIVEHITCNAITDFDNPRYHNVEQMKRMVNEAAAVQQVYAAAA